MLYFLPQNRRKLHPTLFIPNHGHLNVAYGRRNIFESSRLPRYSITISNDTLPKISPNTVFGSVTPCTDKRMNRWCNLVKQFMPINALDSKISKLPYIVAHTVESGFVETSDLTIRVDDNSNKDVWHKTWWPFSVPCWWQLEQECMS